MRIARIEIENHPGIGDLDIDFRGADGKAARLVVIAGENGCGKSVILEAIFSMLQVNTMPYTGAMNTAARVYVEHSLPNFATQQMPIPLSIGWPSPNIEQFQAENPAFTGIALNSGTRSIILPKGDALDHRQYAGSWLGNVFYSKAALQFDTQPISSILALMEEEPNPGIIRHASSEQTAISSEFARKVSQYLVNVQAADDQDLADWYKKNPNKLMPDELKPNRFSKIASAFAEIMPDKRLAGIVKSDGYWEAYFEGRGHISRLSQLSTGEKQVVFRSLFLLQSFDRLYGSVILIDEPELSLHPRWQSKVLPFYDKLVPEVGELTSQIIVATHSPFVVHGSPSAKHIILKGDAVGKVYVDHTAGYPGISSTEVAISAFNLEEFVFERQGNRMVVVTEGRTDAEIIRTAWTQLHPMQDMPFNLMSAGGAKSIRAFLGHDAETNGPLGDALVDRGFDRFLALFDFDREGFDQWDGMIKASAAQAEDLTSTCPYRKRRGANVWAALLPPPIFRNSYAGFADGFRNKSRLTIELMFEDAYIKKYLEAEKVVGAPGVEVLVAPSSRKNEIAEAVREFPPTAFSAFEPLFALIKEILQ